MPLDTTKSIKSITYNGTNIPLYAKPEQEKTVTPTASGVVVTPDNNYTLSKVTVNGDSNLTAENIKSGTKIFGVTGTLESGGGSSSSDETWVMNETITKNTNLGTQTISFTSNSESYTKMVFGSFNRQLLSYGSKVVYSSSGGWNIPHYRKLTFATPPTGELLTWLQANAVKQASDTAVQPSKTLTITSNGTTTITSDVPYDAMGQVDLTVNVSGSGGHSVAFPSTATNWSKAGTTFLIYADGTVGTHNDYTTLSGRTFNNVIAMVFGSNGERYYMSKLTLSSGSIVLYGQQTLPRQIALTSAPNTTPTYFGSANDYTYILVADTIISSIEMYNTD